MSFYLDFIRQLCLAINYPLIYKKLKLTYSHPNVHHHFRFDCLLLSVPFAVLQ